MTHHPAPRLTEYLSIVLPHPGVVLAVPSGLGLPYRATTLPALLAQLAPQQALGVLLLVEEPHAALVRQLAPAARVTAVECLLCAGAHPLCAGACAHPLPAAGRPLRWSRDGGGDATVVHLARASGTRWAYRALIRPSNTTGWVVLDRLAPSATGMIVTHQRVATIAAAKRLARQWFNAQQQGTAP